MYEISTAPDDLPGPVIPTHPSLSFPLPTSRPLLVCIHPIPTLERDKQACAYQESWRLLIFMWRFWLPATKQDLG